MEKYFEKRRRETQEFKYIAALQAKISYSGNV